MNRLHRAFSPSRSLFLKLLGPGVYLGLFLLLMAAAGPTSAQLSPGSIYVCDQGAGAILRVTSSGTVSTVSSGGFLVRPSDLQFDASGQLIVVDGGANALLRIDPLSGQQTLLTSGGSLTGATGIAIETDGRILISSALTQSVIRISLPSNSQSALTAGGATFRPSFLTLTRDGQLLASDDGLDGFSAIHRIDPTTGTRSILAAGLGTNLDLVELNDNRIATALALTDQLLAIEPGDGSTEVVSSGDLIQRPQGMATDWQGAILVAQGNGAIIRVDPATGDQETLLPSGPRNLFGIAVVPGQPLAIPTLGGLGLALLCGLLASSAVLRLRRTTEPARPAPPTFP